MPMKIVYEVKDSETREILGYSKCSTGGRWYFSPRRSLGMKGNGKYYRNLEQSIPVELGRVVCTPHKGG